MNPTFIIEELRKLKRREEPKYRRARVQEPFRQIEESEEDVPPEVDFEVDYSL